MIAPVICACSPFLQCAGVATRFFDVYVHSFEETLANSEHLYFPPHTSKNYIATPTHRKNIILALNYLIPVLFYL